MTTGQRMKNRRKEIGLSAERVAELLGVSPATIYRYENGDIEKVPGDRLGPIASALQTTPAYLMGWKDSSSCSETTIPTGSNIRPMPQTEAKPRIGRIACGEPIVAEQNIEGHDEVLSSWHADFTLMCVGDSMAPKIENGDIVAIRMQPVVENGDIAAVRIGDEATLKRVYLHPDYIELRPINPNYDSIIRSKSEMEDIRIEGKAVGLCRNL